VWFEGNGGANCEWFSVTPSGEKILINDTSNANALKSYRARTVQPAPKRTYGIGLNFGADEASGSNSGTLAATDKAGVTDIAQANWNNLTLLNGTNTTVVGDALGVPEATAASVTWTCANTWSSTGRGEENNMFTGADKALMTGYLDTGAATTTTVTIGGLPEQLTGGGYDAYVYLLGGVGAKGGGYRVLDAATGTVLKDYVIAEGMTNPTNYVPVTSTNRVGNYIVFSGLASPSIKVEATTTSPYGFGSNPRAPINAIQLIAPASTPPQPVLSVTRNGANVTITSSPQPLPAGFVLQTAPSVTGPWTTQAGVNTPVTVPIGTEAAAFLRVLKP
jgi:hypothetical protein